MKAPWLDNTPENLLKFQLVYRLLLSTIIAVFFVTGLGSNVFGKSNPLSFGITVGTYFCVIAIDYLILESRQLSIKLHSAMMAITDILLLTLLMHFSGGIESGVGILLLPAVISSAITTNGAYVLFIAIIAAAAILLQSIFSQLYEPALYDGLLRPSILTISLLLVAYAMRYQLARLKSSMQREQQQRIDLKSQTQLNAFIIEQLSTGIIVVRNKDHRIQMLNDAALVLLGKDQVDKDQPLQIVSQALDNQLSDWLEHQAFDATIRSDNGEHHFAIGFTTVGEHTNRGTAIFLEDADLATRKAQSIKLEALGKLAANIAHEIRNPLGSISHAAQLLEESQNLDADDRHLVNMLTKNSARINTIIENTLSATKETPSNQQLIPLSEWLETLVQELAHKATCSITAAITPDMHTNVDPSQLRQIIVNLIDNAQRHFPRRQHELRIIINCKLEEEQRPCLSICDNGRGIDEAHLPKILEPFFSTSSKGTGLGLHITHELCEKNHIQLRYNHAEGGGSCFQLIFKNNE